MKKKKTYYDVNEVWDEEWDILLKDVKPEEIKLDGIDKMFKELEEKRKAHPVYYFFHDIYWRTYHYLEMLPLRIKSFIQRGKRGWANSDVWGFDYYLSKVISEGVRHLKECHSGNPNGLTKGKWIDILNKISYSFEIAKQMNDELYLIKNRKRRKNWQKTLDETNKKYKTNSRCLTDKEIRDYEEGWALFKEYYYNLWD